jgi:hypothetical protein
MTAIPQHFVGRPPMPTDSATLRSFDALFDAAVAAGPEAPIDYQLAAPRWQFICHIADTRNVVVHGSGNPGITRFEPRQPIDATVFGNQNAVYAASDGLWPMYFAILDRDRYPMWLINGSGRLVGADGKPHDPFYFFSISEGPLAQNPWRRGMIYFLPRDTFRQQPPLEVNGQRVLVPQWASLESRRSPASGSAPRTSPCFWKCAATRTATPIAIACTRTRTASPGSTDRGHLAARR